MPALVAFGLLLSIATHLRVLNGGLVGPGEIVVAGLAVLGWVFCKPWRQWSNPILWFWGLLVLTMTLGALTGKLEGNWVIRNTLAYVFIGFAVTGLVGLFSRLSNEALRRMLALLCCFAAAVMWFGFIVYLTGDAAQIQRLAMNDLGAERYAAWSQNPNQLALFFIPLPVWLVALWRDVIKPSWSITVGFYFLLFLLMLMGLLVRSDGLLVVWIVEFLVLIVLRLRWDLKVSGPSLLYYSLMMVLCVLLVKTFAHDQMRNSFQCAAQHLSQGMNPWKANCSKSEALEDKTLPRIGYSDPLGKVGERHELWVNGLKAWIEAPLFGHGPGAYSKYSDPVYQKNMENSGKPREESHNIMIDLMTQGGILLGAGWLALLLYLTIGAWRVRDSYTLSVVLMIGAFTMFHYHLRQPYLWFVLIVSYEAIQRRLFVSKTN